MNNSTGISRRNFIATGTAAFSALSASPAASAPAKKSFIKLEAKKSSQKLHSSLPPTGLWTYNGTAPGQTLRLKQGEEAHFRLMNGLSEPTSIHWHGLRVPNKMDGVPHLTQSPVKPGESFDYRFRADDAGTFFYHPHINSTEQMGRGLFGALIVEEKKPYAADREVVWVLNDWRVDRDGMLVGNFNNPSDLTHAGRYGNLVSVNGKWNPVLTGPPNERVRLRLINAATGRIFSLRFGKLEPWLIALDGQPVNPRPAGKNDLLIGPGMRADIVLDMPASAGTTVNISDEYYSDETYSVARLKVGASKPTRKSQLGRPDQVVANPIRPFEATGAEKIEVHFAGGAMGGMMGRGGMMMRRMGREMMQRRLFWIVNERLIPPLGTGQSSAPLFRLKRGKPYIFAMENQTAFDHPIHLHGHTFRVLSRNGKTVPYNELRDTVLMRPREKVEIGFVADNPGRWMFHCHILSHVQAGMGGVVEVS